MNLVRFMHKIQSINHDANMFLIQCKILEWIENSDHYSVIYQLTNGNGGPIVINRKSCDLLRKLKYFPQEPLYFPSGKNIYIIHDDFFKGGQYAKTPNSLGQFIGRLNYQSDYETSAENNPSVNLLVKLLTDYNGPILTHKKMRLKKAYKRMKV